MPSPARIKSLDGLRGLASFAVCWFHLTKWLNFKYQGAHPLVAASGQWGWLGVEVFFVISGFVLPYAMWQGRYRLRDIGVFIGKRLIRLDPPYLVSILISLAALYAATLNPGYIGPAFSEMVSAPQVLSHLGYVNAFLGYHWVNPVYWTLAVEFQFYILIGLLFPVIAHARKAFKVAACAALLALAFFRPSPDFIFSFLPVFVMGILCFQYRLGLVGRPLFLCLLAAAAAVSWFTPGPPETIAALFAVFVVARVDYETRVGNFLGDISYSLYLLHMVVGQFTIDVFHKLFPTGPMAYAGLGCGLAVSLASAYVFYLKVEAPSRRWASAISYRRRDAAPAAETPEAASAVNFA